MPVQQDSRRFQAYVIGTGKTGTQSMAGMFAQRCRSAHEPECLELVQLALDVAAGSAPATVVPSFLAARDKRLQLELESDGTLWHFLPVLIEQFPKSKFILTIRDCYSWLNSVFDHNIALESSDPWRDFDDLTYSPWRFEHEPEEEVLSDQGLRTLGHYLSHWNAHNEYVINTTPPDRLLIVRTDQLRESIAELEGFVGIAPGTLDPSKSHLHRTPRKLDLLSRIDPSFVRRRVDTICGHLMKQHFPDIISAPN